MSTINLVNASNSEVSSSLANRPLRILHVVRALNTIPVNEIDKATIE